MRYASMLLLFWVLNIFCFQLSAQELPPPGQTSRDGPLPPGTPIDDHIIILIIAAIVFGIYKAYIRAKRNQAFKS